MLKYDAQGNIVGLVPAKKDIEHWVIFGQTGSGKTTFSERITEVLYRAKKFKVVCLFDSKDDLESAFALFPAEGETKKALLDCEHWQDVHMDFRKPEGIPIKVFHPICKGLSKKAPETFFPFTVPLVSLTKAELAFLGETDKRAVYVEQLAQLLEQRQEDSSLTLPEFLLSLKELKGEANAFGFHDYSLSNQFFSSAYNLFAPFSVQRMISSKKCPTALTDEKLVEILNDQKTYTVFSTKWLHDQKLKFFVTLALFNAIIRLKQEGKIKPNIVIKINDLHKLVPRFFVQEYQKIMISLFFDLITTCRSSGITLVCDTQDPTAINSRLIGQFHNVWTGTITTPNQLQYFAESGARMNEDDFYQINLLHFLKRRAFFDISTHGFAYVMPPRHKHKEPGEDFFKYCKKRNMPFKSLEADILSVSEEFERAVEFVRQQTKKKALVSDLPTELAEKGFFDRMDVETVLGCGSTVARKQIRKWIQNRWIKRIGEENAPDVHYQVKKKE